MRLVQRPQYLAWLNDWREKPVIKVVTGVRRCGKSTLFRLYIDSLLGRGVKPEQIVSINLEELEYAQLSNSRELYAYLKARLYDGGTTYVFIDEVQQCEGFERAVDSLFVKGNVDVHITGSNAFLLSGELATLLSGRYVQIEMLPLSFSEYCDFKGSSNATMFRDYLRFGAFPAVAALGDDSALVRSYLDGIYNSILVKDVARRENIADLGVLENIVKFLLSNIGSPVSLKKIADTLNAAGRTISVNTVDKYVRALCAAYVFYKCDRYDVKGKTLLKTQGKYYAVDSGIRELLLASSASDIGHVLENAVYLELLRRGGKVRIGKVAEKELDFVCETADGLAYYQVSATVLDEGTLKRELEPLQRITDNHPKYLLTLDEIPRSANYDGIRQMNVVDWLQGSRR
ncbi:MAG: ATP-binding protein [Clostridiales Family XIII bacterium]|jgi:predicted AAA+ superfamily ATPase|nr:ATP-binding protein [Clostridiales Family XIII bacterium]